MSGPKLLFELATPRQPVIPDVVAQDYYFITDSSTPSSGGKNVSPVTIDTMGANLKPSEYINYDLSYIWMQHYIQATTASTSIFTPLSVAPKNGYPFINSVNVQMGSIQVNNQINGLYLIANYNRLRRWSKWKEAIAGKRIAPTLHRRNRDVPPTHK